MSILPITFAWKNLPWVTLLLLLVNILVFFISQGLNEKILQKSMAFYWATPLSTIELPLYLESLHQRGETAKLNKLSQFLNDQSSMIENKGLIDQFILEMNYDQDFILPLRAGKIVKPDNPRYPVWDKARRTFDELFFDSITNQYGFIPAKPRALSLITQMFLHSGHWQLFGNMFCLILIGYAVERTIGPFLCLCFYLLTGVGALGCFWIANQHGIVPLVGAAGAVSGLMGLYLGIFGIREIPLSRHSDFKVSALMILPLWLANEYFQIVFTQNAKAMLWLPIGGLLLGFGLAWLLKRRFSSLLRPDYLDKIERQKHKELRYQDALDSLSELNIARSQNLLRELHRDFPNDIVILQQYYKTFRYFPFSAEYRSLVKKILTITDDNQPNQHLLREVYADYCKHSESIHLSTNNLIRLAVQFCRFGCLSDAENIVAMLLKRDRTKRKGLDNLMLLLGKIWLKKENTTKVQYYQELINLYYPHGEAAKSIAELLHPQKEISASE